MEEGHSDIKYDGRRIIPNGSSCFIVVSEQPLFNSIFVGIQFEVNWTVRNFLTTLYLPLTGPAR